MQRTHFTPRGIRRAAAANAGLNPREWRQLEQLVDGSAWLTAGATVPVGAINATKHAVDGVQRLAELGLAEGSGEDRWRATDAGYALVMATRAAIATDSLRSHPQIAPKTRTSSSRCCPESPR